MAAKKGRCRIGTSGYPHEQWRGGCSLETLPKREWFPYYAKHFDTVEINTTFYHLPATTASFHRWRDAAGADFYISPKYSPTDPT